jgi:hypothetical protein
MDNTKTTKNIKFYFSLDLQDLYFGTSKYLNLQNNEKIELIGINKIILIEQYPLLTISIAINGISFQKMRDYR